MYSFEEPQLPQIQLAVTHGDEESQGDDNRDEVIDDLNFIQSFLTSVTQPPSHLMD